MTVNRLTAKTALSRRRGPSPEKTAQTRTSIVDAALAVFLEHGFSETRMIDVADRAGLAKGTLYLYFSDKEALFEGVLREVIAGPVSTVAAVAPTENESVRAFLSRVLLPLLRDMESSGRGSVLRLVIAEGPRFPALAAMYRRLALDPLVALLRRAADHAAARGELRSDALSRFPLLLVSPGLVATVWNGLYGAQEPLDAGAVFEAFLDLIFVPAA